MGNSSSITKIEDLIAVHKLRPDSFDCQAFFVFICIATQPKNCKIILDIA